ncbi:MAG: tetratricopeptide repeat protein, partial [Candidatus Heimdallarchaeota archaeon]
MKEKIEINTMTARNVYSSESFQFVKKVLEKFCDLEIPEKAREIHKQNQGIKYHSYYKIVDKTVKIPALYTISSETFGCNEIWMKFTISSQDGLILELTTDDSALVKKITKLFEKEYGYCRKQSELEIFDELIHELRTNGTRDSGKYGIEVGLKAIKIDSHDFWARFYLGCSYALNDQHKQAIEHLGCSYALNDQHKQAIEHLLVAIERDPESFDALYNLGKSYFKLNKLTKAKDTMMKAHALAQKSHAINYYLALILDTNGEVEEAIKFYQKAIDYAPEKLPQTKLGTTIYLKDAEKRLQE